MDKEILAAAGQIRSYGAVAVLGSGLSASLLPMTAQLPSLVWHAIDASPGARSRLARGAKRGRTAKELIGSDPDALEAAWRAIEAEPSARSAFQAAFSRLDADREPGMAHYALARLVKARIVEYVISFNWDTALERAYEQLFGTSIRGDTDVLIKPHGDAGAPHELWVLPNRSGSVPAILTARIEELGRRRPRVLLILGYSGSDRDVAETLLAPLARRWPVVRVSPSATGSEAVSATADEFLPALADELNAPVDISGWRWVTFFAQRDLRAALLGYRLGPQDVSACPEFASAGLIAERVHRTGLALVTGESGAGKSITAFQAARQLNRRGWGVIELSQPGVAGPREVLQFAKLSGPVVAVVDDAQALAPAVVQAFQRAASADHGVVLITTEHATEEPAALRGGQERVRVAASRAVAALAAYCERHQTEVAPLVAEVDDRVGYGPGQEPFERRLTLARASDYPWQFMYVLSGGEQRIGAALAELVDLDQADLLFGLLAAVQLLTLDAGVSRNALASHVAGIGRDPRWMIDALSALSSSRLALERQDRLRTPHLRIAERGLLALCRDRDNPAWPDLVRFIRSQLLDRSWTLQGKLWLLRAIDQSDPLRYAHRDLVLDAEVAGALVEACLAASAGRDRNIAAYLIWEVEWWRALDRPMAERVADAFPNWIRSATAEDVFGLQWLLGGLRSSFADLHGAISARVGPEAVAGRMLEHGTPREGESWGRLMGELAYAQGSEAHAWASRLEAAIEPARLAEWARQPGEFSLGGNIELVYNLAGLSPDLAAVLVEAMTPELAANLERDVAGAAQLLVPWAFGVFPIFDEADPDAARYGALRDSIGELMAATDWGKAGESLSRAELHTVDQLSLLTWSIGHIAPDALVRMYRSVSIEHLDRLSAGHWGDLSRIEELVLSLGFAPDHEPARTWLRRHQHEIRQMPTRVVPLAPDVAVSVLDEAGQIALDVQDGLRWDWCADALAALHAERPSAAKAVAEASAAAIVGGLALRQANMTEDLPRFVAALDGIDPDLLGRLLDEVDSAAAGEHWPERLRGAPEEAEAVNLLIDRALSRPGEVARIARSLRHPDAGSAGAL